MHTINKVYNEIQIQKQLFNLKKTNVLSALSLETEVHASDCTNH